MRKIKASRAIKTKIFWGIPEQTYSLKRYALDLPCFPVELKSKTLTGACNLYPLSPSLLNEGY